MLSMQPARQPQPAGTCESFSLSSNDEYGLRPRLCTVGVGDPRSHIRESTRQMVRRRIVSRCLQYLSVVADELSRVLEIPVLADVDLHVLVIHHNRVELDAGARVEMPSIEGRHDC